MNSSNQMGNNGYGNGQQMYMAPMQPRAYHALSEMDQNRINNRIDQIPLINRLDFLLSVLGRIETLRSSIETSSRSAAAKERLITLLDDIVDIVQNRISDDISTSPETDDNTPPTTTSFNIGSISTSSAVISATIDDDGK